MDRLEFEVLSSIAEDRSLRYVMPAFGFSDADVEKAKAELIKKGFVDLQGVTTKGFEALEPYRVHRVVFLAAGFGSRMVPITLNTPKPMVRVHGKRIIETLIDAVLDAGINEIYIVRGYLGEEFELLQKKYPMIKLIENPEYDGTGTIASFYYARKLLESAYVMESDLVMVNPKVIRKYHYSSDFMGAKIDETDDWFFKTGENGKIEEVGVVGSGDNCYKLIGISYWNTTDGAHLAHDIQEAYEGPDGKKLPMSFVPFRVYKDRYHVAIAPCGLDDVVEIDSFAELQIFDEAYKIN